MKKILSVIFAAAGIVNCLAGDPNPVPQTSAQARIFLLAPTAAAERAAIGLSGDITNGVSVGQAATNAALNAVAGLLAALQNNIVTNGDLRSVKIVGQATLSSLVVNTNAGTDNTLTLFGGGAANYQALSMRSTALPFESTFGLDNKGVGGPYGNMAFIGLNNADGLSPGPDLALSIEGKYSMDVGHNEHFVFRADATNLMFDLFTAVGGGGTMGDSALHLDMRTGLIAVTGFSQATNGPGTIGVTNGIVVGVGTAFTKLKIGSQMWVGGNGGLINQVIDDTHAVAIGASFFLPWSGISSGSAYVIYQPALVGDSLNQAYGTAITPGGYPYVQVPSGDQTVQSFEAGGQGYWWKHDSVAGIFYLHNDNLNLDILRISDAAVSAITIGATSNTIGQSVSVSGDIAGGEFITLNGLSQFVLDAGSGQLNLHSKIFNSNPITVATNAPNGGGDFTPYGFSTLTFNAQTAITNAGYLQPIEQASFTNVASVATVAITFVKPMPATNYVVSYDCNNTLGVPILTAGKTVNGFTANFQGTFTGGTLGWKATMPTQ